MNLTELKVTEITLLPRRLQGSVEPDLEPGRQLAEALTAAV